MIYRHSKDIVKFLAILILGVVIVKTISLCPMIWNYLHYHSETSKIEKAQYLTVYFDDQFKKEIPSKAISIYAREICNGREITWQTACPFAIKLVFTFRDKSTCDVLIGTDGCKQLRLPSGIQAKFAYSGKLAELEKEYLKTQTLSEVAK